MLSSDHNTVSLCYAQDMQSHSPICRSSGASIPTAKLQSTPSVDSTDASAMPHSVSSWVAVESSSSLHMSTAFLSETAQVQHHTATTQACHAVHNVAHLVFIPCIVQSDHAAQAKHCCNKICMGRCSNQHRCTHDMSTSTSL